MFGRVEHLDRKGTLVEQPSRDDRAALGHRADEPEIRVQVGVRIEDRLLQLERAAERTDIRKRRRHPRAFAVARGAFTFAIKQYFAASLVSCGDDYAIARRD